MRNLTSPLPQPIFDEPSFSSGTPSPDPTRFKSKHPSDAAQYKQIQALLAKDTVGFSPARGHSGDLYTLESALGAHGPQMVASIKEASRLVFHALGDSGASTVGKYGNELSVSDQLAEDFHVADAWNRPAFLFHLGDLVYSFGESHFYYDQFYEPFRNYPAPIFAIPGNHDSFVIPGTPERKTPLDTFVRNFCSPKPVITAEAGSLHRTAMTQPGIYFALDAPFLRILGLFSNALEDPGVLSSEDGKWPNVPDHQLGFLAAQLRRVKQEAYPGALLVAVHHPPFTYAPPPGSGGTGGNHAGNAALLREIDTLCSAQGVYPHAFLSAHAHSFQRYTRVLRFNGNDIEVPFIVCGCGGHNVKPLVKAKAGQLPNEPAFGEPVDYLDANPAVETSGLVLAKYQDQHYGYLRVTVTSKRLSIAFNTLGAGDSTPSQFDEVTVDLSSHRITPN